MNYGCVGGWVLVDWTFSFVPWLLSKYYRVLLHSANSFKINPSESLFPSFTLSSWTSGNVGELNKVYCFCSVACSDITVSSYTCTFYRGFHETNICYNVTAITKYVLVLCHESRCLIGYVANDLFCYRQWVSRVVWRRAVVCKMTADLRVYKVYV